MKTARRPRFEVSHPAQREFRVLEEAPRTARQVMDKAMDEESLLTALVEAALFLGWRVHHDRRSDKALQQGSPGFPDLVLARRGRVFFWEVKAEKGRPTQDQWAWLNELGYGLDVRVITPSDLDAALKELSKP